MSESNWINLTDAADYLGISATGLRRLCQQRKVTYRQESPGGKYWFLMEWLDEYLAARTIRAERRRGW
jgi:hypothetical protein